MTFRLSVDVCEFDPNDKSMIIEEVTEDHIFATPHPSSTSTNATYTYSSGTSFSSVSSIGEDNNDAVSQPEPEVFDFAEEDLKLYQESIGQPHEPKLSITVMSPAQPIQHNSPNSSELLPQVTPPSAITRLLGAQEDTGQQIVTNNSITAILSKATEEAPTKTPAHRHRRQEIPAQTPADLTSTDHAVEPTPSKITGKIHSSILARANFMENLLFKRKDSASDDKPRKLIHTGFDIKTRQQNWEEENLAKREELKKNLKNRINDLGSHGLVGKLTGAFNDKVEDAGDAGLTQGQLPGKLGNLKNRWQNPNSKTFISFGGDRSPTLASLRTGNVKDALKMLAADAPSSGRIVINLGRSVVIL